MLKPDSLRAALTADLTDADGTRIYERDPDKLAIFIDQGRIAARLGGSRGFEWRYRLQAILLDFAGDVDKIALIIVLWIAKHQPELLANHQAGNEAFKFEVDVLDNGAIDMAIEIELSEVVDARARPGGGLDLVHREEPTAWPDFDDVPAETKLEQFFIGDELILEADLLVPTIAS